MKRVYKIAGAAILLALVGALILSAVTFAQGSTSPNPLWPFLGKGGGWMKDYVEQMYNAIASKLGVQRTALDTAVQEAYREVIEQAVADGKITQEQADWLLNPTEAMRAQIEQAVKDGKITREQADWLLQGLEKGYVPYGRGFGFGGLRGKHFGGFGRPRGFWATPKATPTSSTSS
ncbi:MAG: hypothetical protein ACUVWR_18300 [Anaerolineae bacterium]